MKRIKAKVLIPYFLVGFGVCIFLFGSSIESDTAPKQFNPSVNSAVSQLEIIQMKMLGPNVLQVTMRNGCSKDITAVVASIGPTKVTRTDYIFAELEQDQKLSPGATDKFLYTIDSSEQENIVIKAVLFSDMTWKGDYKEVKDVLDKRYGVKIQLARFNSHLKELNKRLEKRSRVDYTQVQTELQEVRQFAENLPIKMDSGFPMSPDLEFGLRHGRAFILKYLSEMNNLISDDKNLYLSIDRLSMSAKYERFRRKSLRVEKDFRSLESRL
jgi:hypothetical protein